MHVLITQIAALMKCALLIKIYIHAQLVTTIVMVTVLALLARAFEVREQCRDRALADEVAKE